MSNLFDMQQAFTLKLLCERFERYDASVSATLHLFADDAGLDPLTCDNIQHLVSLISQEINQLSLLLNESLDALAKEQPSCLLKRPCSS